MTDTAGVALAPQAREAWAFVGQMLDETTTMVVDDAETELELLEGLRVLGRVTALCSELSLDVDVEQPWFFPMCTEARLIGGPNPDGEYQLAMISGAHRYRVRGVRGTSAWPPPRWPTSSSPGSAPSTPSARASGRSACA